jgi:hypothetical protein
MTDTAPPKPRGRPRKTLASVEGSDKPKATKVEGQGGQRGAAPPRGSHDDPLDHAPPNSISRVPEFNQDIADTLCQRIAAGETLRKICEEMAMPDVSTVLKWQRDNPRFVLQYHRARIEQTRTWADQIIELADDNTNDIKTITRKSGKEAQVTDREAIERTKLRIWTRQWLMGKTNRAEFGEGSTDPQTGTPALIDANPQELVVQLVHLLGQFDIKLTPEQVEQVKHAVSRGEDDPAILGR